MFHLRHKWHSYEVELVLVGFIWGGEPTHPRSYVKQRCNECKKLRRIELDGHWRLAELNGEE